jgi:hypothetical protein
MPLCRRIEENAGLHEFKCVELAKEDVRLPAEGERLEAIVVIAHLKKQA